MSNNRARIVTTTHTQEYVLQNENKTPPWEASRKENSYRQRLRTIQGFTDSCYLRGDPTTIRRLTNSRPVKFADWSTRKQQFF